jgi:hypothetical protein
MSDLKSSPEYQAYHKQVVEACVKLMGEQARSFFDTECDYLDEFWEGADPEEVAQAQYDAVT